MILDKIVDKKLIYLKNRMDKIPINIIKEQARKISIDRRSFKDALTKKDKIAIIGEIKKASPSKGLIRGVFNPKELAMQYDNADVQALSILTEKHFFLGDESYLKQARSNCRLPVLRKDFIINKWQIYESYLLYADAILLIAAILDDSRIEDFLKISKDLKLDVLVEVHNEHELERVLKFNPSIIGINNRNLEDFSVSLDTTKKLYPLIPKDKVVVSESGIHRREDVEMLMKIDVDAMLIGESLMRADNIKDAVSLLRGNV